MPPTVITVPIMANEKAKNGNGLHVNGNGSSGRSTSASRKQSSPMAPAFMVSAPGKVIFFGEHSVVYGKVRCSAPR